LWTGILFAFNNLLPVLVVAMIVAMIVVVIVAMIVVVIVGNYYGDDCGDDCGGVGSTASSPAKGGETAVREEAEICVPLCSNFLPLSTLSAGLKYSSSVTTWYFGFVAFCCHFLYFFILVMF